MSVELLNELKLKDATIQGLQQQLECYRTAIDYFTEVHKYARETIADQKKTTGVYMWDLLIKTINEKGGAK